MCGLFAASGKINPRLVRALGLLNSKRGRDSAGVGWWDATGPNYLKIAREPALAFTLDLSDAIDTAAGLGVLIGHTRAATTGAVTSENAHPFLIDGLIFAHNGVIRNHAEFGSFAVDSQCLITGIKERNFSKYEGSVALVWIENGLLHAYREGNPLYRGRLDGGVYLASEKDMLEETGVQDIKEVSAGRVYVFDGATTKESKTVPTNRVFRSNISCTSYIPPAQTEKQAKDWEEQKTYLDNGGEGMTCECGHPAKEHEKRYGSRPACYAKVQAPYGETTCMCHCFELPDPASKKETAGGEKAADVPGTSTAHGGLKSEAAKVTHSERPQAYRTVHMCLCGCPQTRHKDDGMGWDVCDGDDTLAGCPRNCYSYRPSHTELRIPPRTYHEKEMCVCGHEFEYHMHDCDCVVADCRCVWFRKRHTPAWSESWRLGEHTG